MTSRGAGVGASSGEGVSRLRERQELGSVSEETRAGSGADGPRPLRLWVGALVLAAAYGVHPLWAPLVLAGWVAMLARPLYTALVRRFRRREKLAAAVTVALLCSILLPVSLLGVVVVGDAIELGERVAQSEDGRAAMQAVLAANGSESVNLKELDPRMAMSFIQKHGASAWNAFTTVAGATASAVIGIFVFLVGVYTFLIEGKRLEAWLVEHSPLRREHTRRFIDAYCETGRGLFIGVWLTALLQGIVTTIGYFALGLSKAAVLGAVTVVAAFIPSLGAGIVWAPVCLALALTGQMGKAAALLAIGIFVSTADNFVRPALSRYGRLELPMYALLVSMLGGIVVFGAWGLLLGPLLVRLSVEGLRILREPPIICAESR